MSTKIYQAFRVKVISLSQLLLDIQGYRFDRVPEVRRQIIDNLNRAQISDFDKLRELNREMKDRRGYPFCKAMQIGMIIVDDFAYFTFFGDDFEIKGLYDDLLAQNYVEEFGYWNNTDKPAGLTDIQWDEREIMWDRILKMGDGTFRHLLQLEIIPDFVEERDLPIEILYRREKASAPLAG